MDNVLSIFRKVTTFIFDVDGVFTNGDLQVTEDGHLLRTMNAKDGFALKHAKDKGYKIVIITGGTSKGVRKRFEGLGLLEIHISVSDKLELFKKLVTENKINPTESLYMGDDIPDLFVMQKCILPTCPADAVSEIIHISKYVSPFNGGAGCVRDVIEKVLKVQNNWI